MSNQPNPTQIPFVNTDDGNLNQIQQFVNRVFRNLTNKIDASEIALDQMTILGEVKLASLTLEQFQSIAGTDWVLANGQSSVGTKYALLTGNNTVPTVTVTGTTAFIKVN